MNSFPREDDTVLTVSQLNREVRLILEQQFGFLWLEGEISNFSQPASGHWYFSLKDSHAQIRCAMFKNHNRELGFKPKGGDQVLVRGNLGLYEARGDFQLIVQEMQAAGDGLLQLCFEKTKRKLQAKGLFNEATKKTLPLYPQQIAVVTSATGAALQDVLHVLNRRYPVAGIIVYPTSVQGNLAAEQITKAISLADSRNECDVILLVRGGGSLEDLWPFNEEAVAYAIYNCKLPIVSGVGHEVDITIADMVSDIRAPTPSAAAEIATPNIREVQEAVSTLLRSLHETIKQQIRDQNYTIQQFQNRLFAQHPQRQLMQKAQRIDELENRLKSSMSNTVDRANARLNLVFQSLKSTSPEIFITSTNKKVAQYQIDLQRSENHRLEKMQSNLNNLMRALNGVSPLATLDRGYAILKNKHQETISTSKNIKPKDHIIATLSDGEIYCYVEKISN